MLPTTTTTIVGWKRTSDDVEGPLVEPNDCQGRNWRKLSTKKRSGDFGVLGSVSKSQRGRSANNNNNKNSVNKANKDGDQNSSQSNARSNMRATRRSISLRQASMRASLSLAAQFQSKVNTNVNNHNNSDHNLPSSPTHKAESAGLDDMPDNVLALILSPLRQPSLNKFLPLRLTCSRWNAVISSMCKSFTRLRLTIVPGEEFRVLGANRLAVLIPPRPGWDQSETLVICLERLNFPLAKMLHQLFEPTSAMLYLKGRVIQVWHKRPVVPVVSGEEGDAPQQTTAAAADVLQDSVVEVSSSGETVFSSSGSSTNSKSSKSRRKSKQKLVIRRVLSLRQASMKASQHLSNSLAKSGKSNSKVNSSSSSSSKTLTAKPPLNINDLPAEMLFSIFRHLKRPTLNGLIRQRATCRRWNAVVLGMCRAIRTRAASGRGGLHQRRRLSEH